MASSDNVQNTPVWKDLFRTFAYSFTDDPITKKLSTRDIVGAGVLNPDSIPSMSPDGGGGSFGGNESRVVRFRETNDFIDLSTVNSRMSRYKEYERLRNMPEIEMALNVFSDEACLGGATKVMTAFGPVTIKELAETKQPNEKFLVYCYDFEKQDYTLGWAHSPRKTKKAKTLKISLDDGNFIVATHDHKFLLRSGMWKMAGELKERDELMPFFRIPPMGNKKVLKSKQFPRIFTFNKGWIHERQFADEWRSNKNLETYENFTTASKILSKGLGVKKLSSMTNMHVDTWKYRLKKEGFTYGEFTKLSRVPDRKIIIGIEEYTEMDVYDLSVDDHENFATDSCIVHNCQKDTKGNVYSIHCNNSDVKQEIEFLFGRKMLNLNRRAWSDFKNLLTYGDVFYEIIINRESPESGIAKVHSLPASSMYKIETTKGKVLEFQQSKEGPDIQSLLRDPVVDGDDASSNASQAIRFFPEQIVHIKIGEDRSLFYPYGVSIIEPARGPAHQLRLMEDSMLVYRLARSPERRVFYVDVGSLPPFKAEAYIERMKDQFRKRKNTSNRLTTAGGSSAVDEKWHAPAIDEDLWMPIKQGSQSRIETLPGASALGEIDDAVYFRSKLYAALNFPRNYFNVDDPNVTKFTLSSQDVKFARVVERMQTPFEEGWYTIAERHLKLMGFPEDSYEDLYIKMIPPSEWRELSRSDVVTARIANATGLKSAQLFSDYDLLTLWLMYPEDEAKEIVARSSLQKLADARLEVLKSNPALLGIGIPSDDDPSAQGDEVGTTPDGPNPSIGDQLGGNEQPPQDQPEQTSDQLPQGDENDSSGESSETKFLPSEDDIKKYGYQIQDYESEMDQEDKDDS